MVVYNLLKNITFVCNPEITKILLRIYDQLIPLTEEKIEKLLLLL